jgi:hypothetical protein
MSNSTRRFHWRSRFEVEITGEFSSSVHPVMFQVFNVQRRIVKPTDYVCVSWMWITIGIKS